MRGRARNCSGANEHAHAQVEAPAGSILCYNTGRCITDYCGALEPLLPPPDVLVTGDGTEIRWRVDSEPPRCPRGPEESGHAHVALLR